MILRNYCVFLAGSMQFLYGAAGGFHAMGAMSIDSLFDVHILQLPIAKHQKEMVIVPFVAGRVTDITEEKTWYSDIAWLPPQFKREKKQFLGAAGFVYGPYRQENAVEYLAEEIALRVQNDESLNRAVLEAAIEERYPRAMLSFENCGYDMYWINKMGSRGHVHAGDGIHRLHNWRGILMPSAHQEIFDTILVESMMDLLPKNNSPRSMFRALQREAQYRCDRAKGDDSVRIIDVPVLVIKDSLHPFNMQMFGR